MTQISKVEHFRSHVTECKAINPVKPDFFLPIPEASQLGNSIELQVLYIRVSVLGTPEKPLRGCDKFSTGKTTSKDVKTFTAAAL